MIKRFFKWLKKRKAMRSEEKSIALEIRAKKLFEEIKKWN